jgi:hypothetical protein
MPSRRRNHSRFLARERDRSIANSNITVRNNTPERSILFEPLPIFQPTREYSPPHYESPPSYKPNTKKTMYKKFKTLFTRKKKLSPPPSYSSPPLPYQEPRVYARSELPPYKLGGKKKATRRRKRV